MIYLMWGQTKMSHILGLLHSSARSMQCVPAVLVLKDNKTFGKKR